MLLGLFTTDVPLLCHVTCVDIGHMALTQPFHGLVQDLSIGAGIELPGGFHTASAGLQQERNRHRGITYL